LDCQLTARLGDAEGREYDAFVLASSAGHASQTRSWAAIARAGAQVQARFAVVRDQGRMVGVALVLRPQVLGVGLPWAWVERGPVVSDLPLLGDVTRIVGRTLRRQGVARLRVMPYWVDHDAALAEQALRAIGLHDVQTPDGPHACTLRVALDVRDADLFAGKSKEQVRWRAKQAEKAGAVARVGNSGDWARLQEMHRSLMESQDKRGKPDSWWRAVQLFVSDPSRGAFFACDFDGRTVAATVVLRHGPLVTYAWGASAPDKLPFSKAILPLVAAIRWAHQVGCTTFDLGGVPLEDDHDAKRAAIATFKYDFDRKRVRLVRQHAGWC
jgi:hypothetical protein